MRKNFILAVASLIGTIIGAGVFGIPYVMAKSGILFCLFYFLVLGATVFLLHLFFGEVVLRTKQKHRLVGYTGKYLGKKAKALAAFATIFGTIGALLIYIILGGHFLKLIFPFSLSLFQLSLFLWVVLSFFIFLGMKSIAWIQLLMNAGFLGAVLLIFFYSFPKIDIGNFILADSKYIFLPYGVVLFSLVGWNAIPEIEAILIKKKNLKKVIFWAIAISLSFYFLFGLFISGLTGQNTTPEAFEGLIPILGQKIIILGGLFGLFAISTSFLILGNYLKNTLIFDYRFPYLFAFFIATFSPLLLFLSGIREFIWVIAFVGTFIGLIEGTMIILVYKKAQKQGDKIPEYTLKIPRYIPYFVIIVLVLGAIAQTIYYLIS